MCAAPGRPERGALGKLQHPAPHLRALHQPTEVMHIVVLRVHPQLLAGHGLQVGQLALQGGEGGGPATPGR